MSDPKTNPYLIISILTACVSIISLYISIKNRRNALREMLFKEQLNFFMKFMPEISKLNLLIEDVFISWKHYRHRDKLPNSNAEELLKELEEFVDVYVKRIDYLYELAETYDFLLSSDLSNKVKELLVALEDISSKLIFLESGNPDNTKDRERVEIAQFTLSFEIKRHFGADALSSENRWLVRVGRPVKSAETAAAMKAYKNSSEGKAAFGNWIDKIKQEQIEGRKFDENKINQK